MKSVVRFHCMLIFAVVISIPVPAMSTILGGSEQTFKGTASVGATANSGLAPDVIVQFEETKHHPSNMAVYT
jgi:hypothetical protein